MTHIKIDYVTVFGNVQPEIALVIDRLKCNMRIEVLKHAICAISLNASERTLLGSVSEPQLPFTEGESTFLTWFESDEVVSFWRNIC